MSGQHTLTRADLCDAVHDEVGLSRQECSGLVERTLELVVESLERGETVKLSGFGVFQVREKRARMGRNPKTGEDIPISARCVVTFRPGQKLKSRVEVGTAKELVAVLEAVKAAVTAGELDTQIEAASAAVRARFAK